MALDEKIKKYRRVVLGMTPLLLFASISFYFFLFSTPEKIIAWIGAGNAFTLIFVLAFLGGVTTFSGIPYHLVLITLAASGINPFLLGISASLGVMTGDTTSYYVGYHGGAVAPVRFRRIFDHLFYFTEKHPKLFPIFCFLYGSLVPFSNDFITISAGIARYPFWKVMAALGLGNVVFNIGLASISANGYKILNLF